MTGLEHAVFGWLTAYGAAALFALLVLGIVGLPVPDETLLTYAGFLCFKGHMHLPDAMIAAFGGSICGISLSYGIGRLLGTERVERLAVRAGFHVERLEQVHRWFQHRGRYALVFGYFVPGVRHFTAVVAGTSHLEGAIFARWAYAGALLWSQSFLFLGYELGNGWERASETLHRQLVWLSVVVGVVLVAAWWIRRLRRSRNSSRAIDSRQFNTSDVERRIDISAGGAAMPSPVGQTIYDMFQATCRAHGPKVAYLSKTGGRWVPVTWSEQRDTVRRISKALLALGVEHGDRVGLLSQTRLEWLQCDLGISSVGAATLGIYPSTLAADCAYLLSFCASRVLFVEDVAQLRKVLSVRGELPELRTLVLIDGPSDDANGVLSWNDFLARGNAVSDAVADARAAAIRPDDVAALVATSGTTGQQKLAMITHDNLCFTAWSVIESLDLRGEMTTLLFLPLAHVFARVTAYCCLRMGLTVAFAESLQTIGENLKEIHPDFIASVPRIFEKVHEKVRSSVTDAGGLKQKIFDWSLAVGLAAGAYRQAGKPLPGALALKLKLADKLVLHKVREVMGGRLAFAISGAAPLSKSLGEFFHACGVLILEGIGMTENTSFSNVNRPGHYKFGCVGPTGPEIEMAVAEDGEVLYRGRNVMKGYYNNPEATAEAIDANGWLHTGDVGEVDEDAFLRITDRKKDLIITAGGKNVAPQRVERIVRQSRYISQAVAFGDRRKFIAALVTLDPENIRKWAGENGLGDVPLEQLGTRDAVRALIEREIAEQNKQLASYEQVKRFEILPAELTIEAGELTPTLKVKRKVVGQKHEALIEKIYASDTQNSTVY